MKSQENLKLNYDKPAVSNKGNVAKVMYSLLRWAEDRRGRKFVNIPKQFKAMKLMRIAGISPQEIKDRWEELEFDRYWRQRGFDFMDIAVSFDKK